MRLNIKEFESYALGQGYESGAELFEALGYSAEEYEEYKNGKDISRDMLMTMYMDIGVADVVSFVDFDNYEWEQNIDLIDQL